MTPTCYEDESLLIGITSLLDEILSSIEQQSRTATPGVGGNRQMSDQFLTWLMDVCLLRSIKRSAPFATTTSSSSSCVDNPLLHILESPEVQAEPTASSSSGGGGAGDIRLSSACMRRQLCERILKLFSRISRFLFHSRSIDVDVSVCAL